MERKLYLFVDEEDRTPERLILVANYDDKFDRILTTANDEWVNSDEEYYDFVYRALKQAGYQIEELEYNKFYN